VTVKIPSLWNTIRETILVSVFLVEYKDVLKKWFSDRLTKKDFFEILLPNRIYPRNPANRPAVNPGKGEINDTRNKNKKQELFIPPPAGILYPTISINCG
jgi:hypothetical protein